jgi:uncharacterized protein
MRKIGTSENQHKAGSAVNKPASQGIDIDLNRYSNAGGGIPYQPDPSRLSTADKEQMLSTGITLDDTSQRTGTFLQIDNTPIHMSAKQEGIEVLSTSQAIEKYAWLQDYWWKAVAVDTDKYTANVELNQADGYFIRA